MGDRQRDERILDLSSLFSELEAEAELLHKEVFPLHFGHESAARAYSLRSKKWYLTCLDKGVPVFWNSNKVDLDTATPTPYFWFGDDLYAVFKRADAVLAYRLVNDRKLSSRLISAYPELNGYSFASKEQGHDLDFRFEGDPRVQKDLWWSLVLGMVLLLALFLTYVHQGRIRMAVAYALLVLLLDLVIHLWPAVFGLAASPWYVFNTGSNMLASLGAMIIHAFTVFPWIVLIGRFRDRSAFKKYAIPLIALGLFFASDLILGAGKEMVVHSGISFDFHNLYHLQLPTVVGIGAIGMLLFLLILLTRQSGLPGLGTGRMFWTLLPTAVLFILVQVMDANRALPGLLYAVGLVVLILLVQKMLRKGNLRITALYFILLLSLTRILVHANVNLEQERVRAYAHRLINYQDNRAEMMLKSVEDRLAEEFLAPEDYTDFLLRKDAVERRLRQLYFSNYLEKYDLRVVSFDSAGGNINANTLYSFADLNAIYNEQSRRIASNYFYQITGSELINSYIAKYENCDIHGHYGTTFILLQPRLIQSEYLYPEAFENQRDSKNELGPSYSHALYFNRRLISQKGQYDYALQAIPRIQKHSVYWHLGGDFHYYYPLHDGLEVVVTTPFNMIGYWMSTFTYVFLLVIPFAVLLLGGSMLGWKSGTVVKWRVAYISTRIQTSLSLILLIGLLVSVYISIDYLRSSSTAALEDRLLGTIKNIGSQFQNTVDLEAKLASPEQRQRLLNEESSAFKVDLNLFGQNGILLSTTKAYLIDEQVLGAVMNPEAYERMSSRSYSQLMLQEELEGTNYVSAYVPLFNGRNEVISYLNIPYFSKNEQLDQQISTVIVNLVNVYFLLMLGGVIAALIIGRRIARPLLQIRDRFAETGLGIKNELISYSRDDEVGKLVHQYNTMVLQLEESVRKLAASERDTAWREMAKQVAHEIKNPLTPMKLSIQHLQRAYDQGGDKLDDLFRRTSRLLIEQIDSLSRMASEFSSFAQMPQGQFEAFNLSDVARSQVELFERSESIVIMNDLQPDVSVYADPEQIARVIANLIKNAIQSIPEDRTGAIQIRLAIEAREAVLRVEDNGKGIPEDIREKIFEPNFSTKTSGMGLGLAISKKIVEAAGGSILFKTSSRSGTEFTVRLPLYHES